jgi:hypothetical protein
VFGDALCLRTTCHGLWGTRECQFIGFFEYPGGFARQFAGEPLLEPVNSRNSFTRVQTQRCRSVHQISVTILT